MAAESKLPAVTLVLGAAASGKSRYAEQLVEVSSYDRIYVATATSDDAEMAERIRRHRARHGADWQTIEEPHDLTGTLRLRAKPGTAMLVDCLTLWLTNRMLADADLDQEVGDLAKALGDAEGSIVLVSNEVGAGIVPNNQMARRFRDHAGQMNQQIAAEADSVILVTAGLPQILKSSEEG